MRHVILFGLLGIVLSAILISVLCVIIHTSLHQYHYTAVQQVINVPDPDSGSYYNRRKRNDFLLE